MKRIISVILLCLVPALFCFAQNSVSSLVDIEGVAGAGSLPKPECNTQETGIVVVKVIVNQQGKVTQAVAGYIGSTTTDKVLLSAAKEAALKASFKMAEGVAGLTVGTITYGFGITLDKENVHGKGVTRDGHISIADLLDYHKDGKYKIRAVFFGIADEDSLCFYIAQKQDEILPVRLADTPQAREQFKQLMFFEGGEPIEVEGVLSKMEFDEVVFKGLVNATILFMPDLASDVL